MFAFEPEDYARRVLLHLPLRCLVHISNSRLLKAVRILEKVRKLSVEARHGMADLRDWSNLTEIEELDLGRLQSLRSLEGLSSMHNLKKLSLQGITGPETIDEIARLPKLEELYLSGCSQLVDVKGLSQLQSLRILYVARCTGIREFGWLAALQQLRTLDLTGCYTSDLGFCSSLPMLRTLRARLSSGASGEVNLANAKYMRNITLRLAPTHKLHLPSSPSLRGLVISGDVNDDDMQEIGKCSSLRNLTIEDGEQIRDISIFESLRDLRHLVVRGATQLQFVGILGQLSHLESLDLSGSGIGDLEFATDLRCLKNLILDGCKNLQSVVGLRSVRSLQFVSLIDGVPQVDEAELSDIARKVGFRFDHDPYDPDDYFMG